MTVAAATSTGRRVRRRGRAAVAVVVATGLAATLSPQALAKDPEDRRAELTKQINSARAGLVDLTARTQDAVLELRSTQTEIARVRQQLAQAQATLVRTQARKKELDAALVSAENDVAVGKGVLQANQNQLQVAEDRVDDLARAAYQGGGSERFAVLAAAQSARDLTERLYIVERVSERQQVMVGDLQTAREQAIDEQRRLEAASAKVDQLRDDAKVALDEATDAEATVRASQDALTGLEARQKQAVAQLNAQKAAEAARINEMQAESDKITAMLKARAEAARRKALAEARKRARAGGRPASSPPRQGHGVLSYPVNGPITSEFGMRFHPVLHYWRLHAGMDFGVACGTPVYAAASGDIISAGWGGGYGNRLIIAHAGPLATTYNHLTSFVRRGGHVNRGQLIAYSGTTGLSTGCHLHFEVRVNGVPVNPRKYL